MLVVGSVLAAFVALIVAGQLYLSMINHGHSFARLYFAEWSRWMFWALAAPLVVRAGARLMGPGGLDRRAMGRAAGLAAWLIPLHYMLSVQFVLWLRPLWPMTVNSDWFVVASSQLPTYVATDLLLFVLLLIVGNAYAVYGRARRVELREVRLETELARAQLDTLRLEIQPHFLFNSLNSIAALIRLRDNAGALRMLLGLSDLIRATVEHPKDHLVPLAAEMDFLERYVDLQQTRFADRLVVEYHIDEPCRATAVPPFLLQPLVENAIRHGASPLVGPCRIDIGARCEGGRLRVWVADDGAGLRPGFDLTRDAGTGLRNIVSRLRQIYGDAATFEVAPREGGGTSVVASFPAVPEHATLRQPA
jgi:two-component system LytT family sensor kinase